MSAERVRTHIVLPRELLTEIDAAAGNRQRSEYIIEALQEKLSHDRLGAALEQTAGILDLADYPEWETPEKVSEWVHRLRRQDAAQSDPEPGERVDQ